MINAVSPHFSIIVPFYNAEKCIESCADSIANQNYSDYELVLVDDGSQDNSWEVVNRIAKIDKRVKLIHISNSGVSVARNTGFSAALGEIVLFVDADDELEPEALHRLYEVEDDSDIIVFGWRAVHENGGVISETLPPSIEVSNVEEHIYNCLRYGLSEYVFTYAFRKSSLTSHGFQKGFLVEGCGLFEDVWSIHNVLRSGEYRIKYLPEALYRYKQVEGSATHKHDPKLAREGLSAIKALSTMPVPLGCEDEWHAKLLLMALSGADWAAGPGLGDGQRCLHKEIEKEVRAQASMGGAKGLNSIGKLKLILFYAGLYRVLRRILSWLK